MSNLDLWTERAARRANPSYCYCDGIERPHLPESHLYDQQIVQVFTDGTLMPGNRGGWAYVIKAGEDDIRKAGRYCCSSALETEVVAVCRALDALAEMDLPKSRVLVRADCQSTIDRLARIIDWLSGKAYRGKKQKNFAFFKDLQASAQRAGARHILQAMLLPRGHRPAEHSWCHCMARHVARRSSL